MTTEREQVASRCEAAGFYCLGTGGGCLAWRREAPAGHHVLITDADGTGLGETLAEKYLVGLYDADDENNVSDEVDGIDAAIARANELAATV
jgi:hypothetical protein